jgi:phosphate transporter
VAKQQLKLHQREHVACERDTVWRLMIGQTRRGERFANSAGRSFPSGGTLVVDDDDEIGVLVEVPTPAGRFRLTRRKIAMVCALAVFVVFLSVRIVEGVEANRCLAILVFSTVLWATEVRDLAFSPSLFVAFDKQYLHLGHPIVCDVDSYTFTTRSLPGHSISRR